MMLIEKKQKTAKVRLRTRCLIYSQAQLKHLDTLNEHQK